MLPEHAIAAVAQLSPIEGRPAAAQRLAAQVGAEALVVLVRNDVGRLLPAQGLRKTLPGGAAWRRFVVRCAEPGLHRGEVTALDRDALVPAAACSNGETALLFLGGDVAGEALESLAPTLPLLAELLRAQHANGVRTGELATAQFEMRQYASLARALDDARGQVDRTVRELSLQARNLEEARTHAEQAARAKDQFLAMLGHELRNPLAPMVTVLQLLRQRGQWSPEHAIMQRQVEHMQRLVEDLLDVSRIAGGKLVLHRRVIELADAVRSAQETAHPLVAQKGQHVDFDVPSSGLPVDADPARLAQVFSNLLTNASKYSDSGSRIAVRARRAGDWLVAEVIDQGAGIEAAMLERVFELFEQEDTTIDRAQSGLGLGLAIVRNLVQQHGGEVRALSEGIGHGSRFVVRLPTAKQAPKTAPTALQTQAALRATAGQRVLLVDDNADALTTLSAALRMSGFNVEIAVDGTSALEVAQVFRPHVALLDIGLPGMDGYQLATGLRSMLADRPPRLVAITGYGQPSEKRRALEAGFDVHLVKPVDFEHLHGVIEKLLAPRGDGGCTRGSGRGISLSS